MLTEQEKERKVGGEEIRWILKAMMVATIATLIQLGIAVVMIVIFLFVLGLRDSDGYRIAVVLVTAFIFAFLHNLEKITRPPQVNN